ncbi:DUF3325 family protein [Sphingomonas sp. Mn802worker]|uniref:DUF3325 family protein n=1 Tax=Sphingomonas sp. Mn802worker TaxID=629773 RepID=UPI000377EF8E
MSMVAILLAVTAFGALGLSTDRHYQRVTKQRLAASSIARVRIAAWLILTLSAAASIVAHGWAFGLVWWCGFVMLAAGSVFLTLNLADLKISK